MAKKKKETQPLPEPRVYGYQYVPPEGKEHNRPWDICTLNIPKREVDGVQFDAEVELLSVNHALQYILRKDARHWDKQKAALDRIAATDDSLVVLDLYDEEDNPKGKHRVGEVPDELIRRPPEVLLQQRVSQLEDDDAAKAQKIAELEAESKQK